MVVLETAEEHKNMAMLSQHRALELSCIAYQDLCLLPEPEHRNQGPVQSLGEAEITLRVYKLIIGEDE